MGHHARSAQPFSKRLARNLNCGGGPGQPKTERVSRKTPTLVGVCGVGLLGRTDAGPSSILRSAGVTSARDFGSRDYTHRAVYIRRDTAVAGTYGSGREAIGARQAHGETGSSAAELTDRTAANTTNCLQHGSRMAALVAQTVPRFGAHTLRPGCSTKEGTAA